MVELIAVRGSGVLATDVRRRFALAFCMAVALAAATAAPALAQSEFTAKGSAEQVYATGLDAEGEGLPPRQARARSSRPRSADDLGGVLFRKVKPGKGYRVRAGEERSPAR